MTGIRKRVTIGFLSIVVLLFFSGLVSLYELNHMSTDIESILASNKRSIELSETMLDAIRANDRAVVSYVILCDTSYVDSCRVTSEAVRAKIAQARGESNKSAAALFDSLDHSAMHLEQVVEQLLVSRAVEQQVLSRQNDTLVTQNSFNSRQWYDKVYLPAYNVTSNSIMQVMSNAQTALTPRAERLSRNAYRAVTPVFISLVVMLVIVVMFYFLFKVYFVKPVLRINRSLGNFLTYRMPFDNTIACRDEVKTLRERINDITTKNR
jgi:dGTP triphosphohydrolase